MKKTSIIILMFLSLGMYSQQTADRWDLKKCIDQALKQNIQLQQSNLAIESNLQTELQAKAARLPSFNASAGYNFNYSRSLNAIDNKYGNYNDQQSLNCNINSSIILYNGYKTRYNILRASMAVEAEKYNVEKSKNDISLNILDAYLQILYAEEQVNNARKQVDLSVEQLKLATERQNIGILSKADFLQVKSQLATERSALSNANKNLIYSKMNLLQIMEMPASTLIDIVHPELDSLLTQNINLSSDSVYAKAVNARPEIKSADLNVELSKATVNIAKSDYLPRLSLNGEIGTGYGSSFDGLAFDYQMKKRVSPSLGLALSIPIYQNRQVKTNVKKALIEVKNAELSAQYSRSLLRKEIEQDYADVVTAEESFAASKEEYDATLEAYHVAEEKYAVGMFSSIDFLIQKTKLITAESNFLQAKYNLIFSRKTLEYYSESTLSL